MSSRRAMVLSAAVGGAAAAVCFGASPVAAILAVQPIPETGTALLTLAMLLTFAAVIGSLMCLMLAMYAMVFVFVPSRRVAARNILCFSLSFLVIAAVVFQANRLVRPIREAAFEELAQRSALLVDAVHRYVEVNGSPPNALSDLVPDYLAEVPSTEMSAYPDYWYDVVDDLNERFGNPWVLVVSAPSTGLDIDYFIYLPLQNFPVAEYSGVVPLGEWVYVYD